MKSVNASTPFAVYGSLRSGTTLLRLMIDQHPELSCPGETDFVFDHLTPDSATHSYNLERLRRSRIYRSHENRYADNPLENPTPQSFVERISEDGTKVPILMLHRNLSRALDTFPDIRVLHLIRDPRDVARSSIGMGWAGHVYYGIDHWTKTEDEWQQCKSRMTSEQYLEITYETLIEHPEDTLKKAAAFLGCDYTSDMLNYDSGSTYSKPDPSLTFQWKRKQTPQEVGLVEAKIGNRLALAGYEPSGHALIHPTGALKAKLWLQNKQSIWALKGKRFGYRDTLLVMLSKKLRLRSLGRSAQRRIDEKTVKFLK